MGIISGEEERVVSEGAQKLEPPPRLEPDPVQQISERVRDERADRGRELHLHGLADDLEAAPSSISISSSSGEHKHALISGLAVDHNLYVHSRALVVGSVDLDGGPVTQHVKTASKLARRAG